MTTAKIIDPFKRKTRVTCSSCELSYTARNYEILYENEKLAFFKIKLFGMGPRQKTYCHDCFYTRIVDSMGPLPMLNVKMLTLEGELTVTFYKKA